MTDTPQFLADWQPLTAFPKHMRASLRWLLRHAAENGIVEAGVAMKFGRAWLVNVQTLPEFLKQQTSSTHKESKRVANDCERNGNTASAIRRAWLRGSK